MPSTLKHGIVYPSGSVAPNVPIVMQTQAESVDAAIEATKTVPFGHMGRTAGFQAVSAGGTVVAMDAAQDLRGGMTFDNATDSLVIPVAGLYRLTVRGYLSGSTGYLASVKSQKNLTDLSGSHASTWKSDGSDYMFSTTVSRAFAVGDKVNLICSSSNGGGSTWGTDGYNGAYIELQFVGK